MKSTKQIDIYLTKKRNVRLIDVVQYDTGIQLVFTVKDFTIPSGATATLYVQKPSGKFVYQEDGITTSGNTVTINLENQAITEHGKVPYQVSLKSGSDVITTFTGMMMVEKSLKDSGATESKTVIRAFDEAVSDHVAEFQTKAEQIVQACIATIPEDYTVMEAKVNELANAVKGYMSGTVVVADDVSPVEHCPVVRIHGKNLLKPEAGASWQCTASVASDGKITLTNTETDGVAFARVGTLELKKGKTYVYTRYDPNNIMNVLTWKTGTTTDSWYPVNGVPYTVKEDVVVDIAVYMADISAVGNTSSIYIQIEEGEVATDYEPYIDPSTVTVKRSGKNVFDCKNANKILGNSTVLTRTENRLTITGLKQTWQACCFALPVELTGSEITISGTWKESGANKGCLRVQWVNGVGTTLGDIVAITNTSGTKATGIVPAMPEGAAYLCLFVYSNSDGSGIVEGDTVTYTNIQVEIGDVATDFEAYKTATTHIPAADGTVSGVTSVSPNMTILTDTEGVIVECEYNRDTNKVIDKLVNAITALGGTV